MGLATSLIASGYSYTITSGENICYFLFDESVELLDAIDDYWNGKMRLEPKFLLSIRAELVSRIKQELHGAKSRLS